MRWVPCGAALLMAAMGPASAVDALAALDTYNFQSAIILKCHPGQNAAERAYLANGEALRKAALAEVASEFDAVNPTHRRENRLRAEETLQEKRAARDYDVDEQIRNYGCDWLDGRVFEYQTTPARLGGS